MSFKEQCVFISTDDKNKIKVGEPDCPISAVTRGSQVLAGYGQVVQSANHDFSSLTLTVVLVHDIPQVDKSWYRCKAHTYMKISATEPSSTMGNATEIEHVLTRQSLQYWRYAERCV